MGMLGCTFKTLLKFAVVFCIVVYLPGLPPHVNFSEAELPQFLPLLGSLRVNDKLNTAEHWLEGDVHGPECIVHKDGILYTGVHNGQIVQIKDNKVTPLVQFGELCKDLYEEGCGRPLGMKFGPDGNLYVADAYLGIFKVDVKTKKITQLVLNSKHIQGKIPKLFNSVDVAKNGDVFWTLSSSDFHLHELSLISLSDGSGRLYKYDSTLKTNEVLIDNLLFANGVALSKNEDFIIVCDGFRSQILRYYLKGPKKGTQDVFVAGLPGILDNIKTTGRGTFFVSLVVPSEQNDVYFSQKLQKYPLIRKFVVRILYNTKLLFQFIDRHYPNYYAKLIHNSVANVGFAKLFKSRSNRFTAVEIDESGNVIKSYHNTDNSLQLISDFSEIGDYYYAGSPFTNYIGRIKKKVT